MSYGPAWLFDGLPIADPHGYGQRAVDFLQFLKHPKSRRPDKALAWDEWQLRIVRKIYGPCHDDGRRICRVVYLQVGRGARKTSLGGSLGLLHTFGPERIASGQVISAAGSPRRPATRSITAPSRRASATRAPASTCGKSLLTKPMRSP